MKMVIKIDILNDMPKIPISSIVYIYPKFQVRSSLRPIIVPPKPLSLSTLVEYDH